jgi:hypothetical protein
MDPKISRRELVITGASLLLFGCRPRDDKPATHVSAQPYMPPPAGNGLWYETGPADSLESVSRLSGLSMVRIVEANHLTKTAITPGMRLWLPGVTKLHTAAPIAPPEEMIEQPVRTGTYTIVPRAAWTKDAIKGNNNPMGGVQRITLHHTGEHAGLVGLPDIEVVQRIEKYHRNERHWAAIGYHYLVGKDGRIYEGRPVKFQGAHVSSENEHNLGISVMGDFDRGLPNSRQLAAVQAFLGDQATRFKVAKRNVHGHRDLNKSVCPGDALYAWLRGWKKA